MFGELESDSPYEKVTRFLRATYWLTLSIVIGPTAYLMTCLAFLPLRIIAPELYKRIENFLCSNMNKMFGVLACTSGFEILEYGDDVDALSSEKCLVMINHQSHADHFPLLSAFAKKSSGHGAPVWMVYKFPALRWCPLGIAWAHHGNFFVQVGRPQVEMNRLKRHLKDVYFKRDMDWLVLYPEGATLPKYKLKSQEYAKEHGFPHLNHSALPRIAALKTVLDENKKKIENGCSAPIKYIIDVTMAWKGGYAPFIDDMFGSYRSPQKTHLLYRVY
uniref:Phospholipid/glycerol acyltransferase domain-containing protein n=1 Tax=Plectus sambesii TaxID=2011161 RepID=A0A914VD36_9BILA